MTRFISVCLAISILLPVSGGRAAAQTDIVFWNLENFFDYFDDGGSSSDSDFSSRGSRRWTKARFTKKCNMVGKALLWMGENCCAGGEAPEIAGVAEVENGFVLNRLVNSPVLKKMGYGYVHYDSPDRRGIDVALLYRRDRVRILSSRPVHIFQDEGTVMPTRDILHVHVELFQDKETPAVHRELDGNPEGTADGRDGILSHLHLLVNHHPSKFSGAKTSARNRELAMAALRDVCDSIARVSSAPIVAMGDFNDTPDGAQFALLEGRLENLAVPLAERGEGTIRYDGRWELIDHFLVGNMAWRGGNREASSRAFPAVSPEDATECNLSAGCVEGGIGMSVVQIPFLMTEDRAHTGFKPLRAYSGPRHLGGVSDHCPILLRL